MFVSLYEMSIYLLYICFVFRCFCCCCCCLGFVYQYIFFWLCEFVVVLSKTNHVLNAYTRGKHGLIKKWLPQNMFFCFWLWSLEKKKGKFIRKALLLIMKGHNHNNGTVIIQYLCQFRRLESKWYFDFAFRRCHCHCRRCCWCHQRWKRLYFILLIKKGLNSYSMRRLLSFKIDKTI